MSALLCTLFSNVQCHIHYFHMFSAVYIIFTAIYYFHMFIAIHYFTCSLPYITLTFSLQYIIFTAINYFHMFSAILSPSKKIVSIKCAVHRLLCLVPEDKRQPHLGFLEEKAALWEMLIG